MTNTRKNAGRPEGRSRQETQQILLTSAKKCFASKGYDGTTFKAVADEADVTPAAIYQYFDSKMALYSATLDKTLELLLPNFFEAISQQKTLIERIKSILETAISFQQQDEVTTAFLVSIPVELARHPDLHDYLGFDSSGIVASMVTMLKEAKQRGELAKNIDEEGFMLVVLGGIMGITLFQNGLRAGSAETGINTLLHLVENSLAR